MIRTGDFTNYQLRLRFRVLLGLAPAPDDDPAAPLTENPIHQEGKDITVVQ